MSIDVKEIIEIPTLNTNQHTHFDETDKGVVGKHLRLFQEVRALLARKSPPDEFFRSVSISIHEIFGYPIVGIYTIENDELLLHHAIGFAPTTLRTAITATVIGSVAQTGEPIFIPNVQEAADDIYMSTATTSEVAVPLFAQGKIAGVLNVKTHAKQALGQSDFELIQILSEYISLGLEQMRLFSALQQSEQRHKALLDTVPDMMFVHNSKGIYLDYHTTRFYEPKIPLETVLGKRIADIFDEEFEASILPYFHQALETGEVCAFEYSLPEDDGLHYYEVRIVAYGQDKLLSIVRDITEAKQLEQYRAQRLAEVEAASRAKDEFLATMSHELRTPLHSILTLGESLREEIYGPISRNQSNVLVAMDKSGRHLLTLINDILDIAKIEAGKFELEIQPIDLRHTLQTALDIIWESANRKNIKLIQTIDQAVEQINADERRLVQILVNLLSNAIKFTPNAGTVGIEVIGDAEDQRVRLIVWDTGIGIAKENQKRLFKPFVQLDSTLSRQYEGTGLGLALVQRLTEMHGGTVTIESAPQKGSRFTITLPWREAEKPEPTKHNNHVTSVKTSPKSVLPKQTSIQTARPLVLLVEDNLTSREAIETFLSANSCQVITAGNGTEAIRKAADHHPDLILMDLQIPEMDGLQVSKAIRRNLSLAHVPIIALTALAMPGDRERCLAAGINEYLSKPVGLRQLLGVITAQLAHKDVLLASSQKVAEES